MARQAAGAIIGKQVISIIAHTTHALGDEPINLAMISRQITHGEDPDTTTYTTLDIYRADGQPLIDEDLLPWRDYGDRVESDAALDIASDIAAELQIRQYTHGPGRGWQDFAPTWRDPSHLTISIASGKDI